MADDFGDVVYETWRRGGNVDRLDPADVREALSYGDYADEIAEREVRRQERASRALWIEDGQEGE